MAQAHKLPSGSWRVLAFDEGHRKSFTAETKRQAEYLALQWLTERKEKRNPVNRTVADMMDRYIEERSNILSPTTITGYRCIRRQYFQDLMDRKVSDLSASDVQMEINKMAATLSPKSIRNAVGFLNSSCDLHFKLTLPKKEKKIYKTPGVEGIKHIIAKTKGSDIEVPVLLAVWCGLRMSEIRGLRFDHVFPDRIVIDQAIVDVDGVPVVKGTKTKESTREIEIIPWLYERIMREKNGGEYVTEMKGQMIYAHFKKLTDNACRFHDLRHANASVMMMLGVPDNVAMERGGWETESIYKKTYAQAMEESRKESNRKINSFFYALVN